MTLQRLLTACPARALALAAAAACLPAAHAETSPYYIGARETITRDSNVYRAPVAISDTILSTGIFGGLDQQISRQRLRANVSADWNRYRNEERLNNTSGSGLVRLDWATVEHLSGDLQVSHSQNLYRDYLQASQAEQKTVVKTTDAAFNARLGVVTAWTLEAGVFGNRTRYDNPLLIGGNLDYNGYRAGVRYGQSSILNVGLAARHADGHYPNLGDDLDFKRNDIQLLINWQPTGSSMLDGWISRSRVSYESARPRSDNVTTGSLTYRYRPGGRLTLDALFNRDTSAGQYTYQDVVLVDNAPLPLGDAHAATTRISTTTGLSAGYELTGKIKLALNLRHTERQLDNTLDGLLQDQTISASDKTNRASLTASYDATRSLSFSCGVTRVKRSAEGSASLTYSYAVNLANCAAQFALQL
ncbi:hypothetical protein [Ideonella sp. BN130291]|uniref:hypothetical protein n=1 Tax=Ideonella sp. BN130291 TaxID=3112940 RepID=UPI002E26359E|nr:hypothetical protein [Ideonella sp. BN130291]